MGKYLVLTGGSTGIGKKTIGQFMAQGWEAINISRSNCALPSVINMNIDLSSDQWVQQYHQKLSDMAQNAEKICLVHNAAKFERDSVMTLTEESLRSVLQLNLVSPVSLNKILLPFMRPGSSIIYIGSTLSEMAVPDRASYVISKHALVGLMRSTCQDLAGKEISTCCICPGFVNTKMLTEAVDRKILDELIKQNVTAGRLIEPEEIADLIFYCATHPVMNGAVLHANLGQVTS